MSTGSEGVDIDGKGSHAHRFKAIDHKYSMYSQEGRPFEPPSKRLHDIGRPKRLI